MNGLAAPLLALAVMQAEPVAAPPPEAPASAPERTAPPEARQPSPVAEPAAPAPAPAPEPLPVAPRPPAQVEPAMAPARPTSPAPGPVPAEAAERAAPRPVGARATPRPERERALGVALSFLDALLRSDAPSLAAASTLRFSFDGDAIDGRDLQIRRWREAFARRAIGGGELRDLVLLEPGEAVAALGPPPPGLEPLAGQAAWIAVADVSQRAVILFLVREGDRLAVAGLHD